MALFLDFELRNSPTALGIAAALALEGIRKNESARFYSPTTGRFIGEDPIGFGGGDTDLYRYVWNEAVTLVDPLGLLGWVKQAEEYWLNLSQESINNDNLLVAAGYFLASKSIVAAESLPTPFATVLDVTEAISDPCLTAGRRAFDISTALAAEFGARALRNEESLSSLYRITGSSPANATHYARNLRRLVDTGKHLYDLVSGARTGSQ